MKTAEEWVSQNGWGDYETIKRIQLDALREAAEIADSFKEGQFNYSIQVRDAILARIKEVEG